jgi:hypothetical protein
METPMNRISLPMMALLLMTATAWAADPTIPAFDVTAFAAPKANPWYPMAVGSHAVIAEAGADADDEPGDLDVTQFIVTGPGPVVMGVQTTQVLDEEWEDGHVSERTFDLVATDDKGNLWYFGEEVTNYTYDDGELVDSSTSDTWRAGQKGAVPGILLPGEPVVGQSMFVAQAPEAGEMDWFAVLATDATVTGPAGSFSGVLKLSIGTPLHPDAREVRYFAPGVGLVRVEDGLSPAMDNPEFTGERQP